MDLALASRARPDFALASVRLRFSAAARPGENGARDGASDRRLADVPLRRLRVALAASTSAFAIAGVIGAVSLTDQFNGEISAHSLFETLLGTLHHGDATVADKIPQFHAETAYPPEGNDVLRVESHAQIAIRGCFHRGAGAGSTGIAGVVQAARAIGFGFDTVYLELIIGDGIRAPLGRCRGQIVAGIFSF